jgi:hypothetical protein
MRELLYFEITFISAEFRHVATTVVKSKLVSQRS